MVADVIRDLRERLGYTYEAASMLVYGGGLRIETAMDEELQGVVEAYYSDPAHFPEGEDGRPQSGFILMDPATGDILAVAGAVEAGEKREAVPSRRALRLYPRWTEMRSAGAVPSAGST